MDNKLKIFVLLQIALAGVLLVDSFARDIISKSILTILIGILFVVLFIYYKLRPDNRRNFKDAFYTLIIIGATYYIFIYILGMFTGFYNNLANASFLSVFGEVIKTILFILALEFFRYIVISNEPNSKLVLTLLVIVLSLCDVSDNIYRCNLSDISDTVYLAGNFVVPSILKNIALTYLALKSSYKLTIFYRLIFELPILFLPIVPALGEYFNCVVSIVLPTIVFAYVYYNYSEKNKKTWRKKHRYIERIASVIITVVIAIVIGLVSGFFKYYVIAVGSNSMEPEIKKGDVVLVKKLSEDEFKTLKEGDTIVFKYAGMLLVHKIVSINEDVEGLIFRTKGDANADEDTFPTLQKNVVGIACGKIPKIGIPTVWVKELSNF